MNKKIKEPLLINAQEMHRQHPETFWSPTDDTLSRINKGDSVKVACNGERFWTLIESRDGDIFTATVDNYVLQKGLKRGDRIRFHSCNVFDVFDVPEEMRK